MSKLDDMITQYAKSCFGDINVWKDDKFKQQIKDLMLDIGEELQQPFLDTPLMVIPFEAFSDRIKEL